MKLKIISCITYAQPETDSDLQSLLKMIGGKERKVPKAKRYVIHKKRKESCGICGKKVKVLKMHLRRSHDPEYRTRILQKNAEKRARVVTKDTTEFATESIQ
jgi:hypothetical protein